MTQCRHNNLTLIPSRNSKLRCRRCHLTIDEKEIDGDCCPECQETLGIRHRDFERLETEDDGNIRYRCEECGAIIFS